MEHCPCWYRNISVWCLWGQIYKRPQLDLEDLFIYHLNQDKIQKYKGKRIRKDVWLNPLRWLNPQL